MIQKDTAYYWFQKGDRLFSRKLYKKANRAYKKVVEIDPQNANAWNNLGISLYAMGSIEEAVQAYDRAIDMIKKWGDASPPAVFIKATK